MYSPTDEVARDGQVVVGKVRVRPFHYIRGGGFKRQVVVWYMLHLKANFETGFSLDRFKG